MEEKKISISLPIANVAPIDVVIPQSMERMMREIAEGVNIMWSRLSVQYPKKKSPDILAMVAFHFAKAYFEIAEEQRQQDELLAEALKKVDDILLRVD